MKKYSYENFVKKYEGSRHIYCGVNYCDGDKDTFVNASLSQIKSYVNLKGKQVNFVVTK